LATIDAEFFICSMLYLLPKRQCKTSEG